MREISGRQLLALFQGPQFFFARINWAGECGVVIESTQLLRNRPTRRRDHHMAWRVPFAETEMEWLNKPDKMEKRRHFLLRGEEEEYEEDVLGSQRNRGEEGRKEAVFFVRQQVVSRILHGPSGIHCLLRGIIMENRSRSLPRWEPWPARPGPGPGPGPAWQDANRLCI